MHINYSKFPASYELTVDSSSCQMLNFPKKQNEPHWGPQPGFDDLHDVV